MKKRALKFLSALSVCAVLAMLLLLPESAAQGAKNGLAVCATAIIPSLFPFMAVCGVFIALGLPYPLGRLFEPVSRRVLGLSGGAATVFLLGLIGGYPLGANAVTELYVRGEISKREAHRLLFFCDNCGAAFILSVAGGAVFSDAAVGAYLWSAHIFSALLLGLFARKKPQNVGAVKHIEPAGLAAAFTESVKKSALSCLTVCGFVVFFSALLGALSGTGALHALAGRISEHFGVCLHFSYSLLAGLLELGTGVSSLGGLSADAPNLALCAFLLGWGGVCVQAQAAAICTQGGLSAAAHFLGKLLHGFLSALLVILTYPLFFQSFS